MLLEAILLLLAGVGVFIAGMNMLSGGLEKSAGGGLKRLLGKISGNLFSGVGIGAAVTALVQSSSATSVMAIGFVNAGIMTLMQATAIIMGANIGTTITGIIVAFSSLEIVKQVMAALAFVGVMMTFVKTEKVKQIGGILCGFGLIFVGLDVMGSAFKGNAEINGFFVNLFSKINFPLLLILCGMLFTAVIQSSSAATGIFITMVGSGALGIDYALFLVLGSNIGTCITALIACMGATVNAKRTAFIHLTFNVLGTIVFAAFIWMCEDLVVSVLQGMLPGNPEMQLAWFHVLFNVTTTLLLLPFVKQLVKLAECVVKEKPAQEAVRRLRFVDDRILKTPAVAMMQVKKEMEYMTALAKKNLENSFAAMDGSASDYTAEIKENEGIINYTNGALTKFLIKLSGLVDTSQEKTIGAYFHVLNDVERIGDHAENFYDIALQMQDKGLAFSETAQEELKIMKETVLRMFALASEIFENKQVNRLQELTDFENQVDGLKRNLSANHFARLAEGNCCVELSPYYSSTVAGLERVGDHLVNVGYSILDPTGSQSEAKKAVAIALRNRYRRAQLPTEIREEITPKNIIMKGPTGVGKTEIARRLAKLVKAPFVKVEATKYTEVGYVGKDVEGMIRDLAECAYRLVKSEKEEEVKAKATAMTERRLVKVLAEARKDEKGDLAKEVFEANLLDGLRKGQYDNFVVEMEVVDNAQPMELVPGGAAISIGSIFGDMFPQKKKKRRLSVREAFQIVLGEESEKLMDEDAIKAEALYRAENDGIVFIDEIDKIAGKGNRNGADVSREGVQRDILPIVEGSTVVTKYGAIKTDFILFIAAGAFHVAAIEDLIPELQGRFPVSVELQSLTKEDFVRILTETENSLTFQYKHLLSVDNIDLEFDAGAIERIAEVAVDMNLTSEDIGARRLHTVMEYLLEDISFNAGGDYPMFTLKIDKKYVDEHLQKLTGDRNLKKYVL